MTYIQKSYQKKFGNKDNSMETNIIEDVTYLVEKANNTPAPAYKVYTALLTQSGTDAPVATVLENTLGFDINWIREANGGYPTDNLSFDETKTVVFITPSTDLTDTPTFAIGYSNSGGYNRIIIYTVNDGVYSDDMLKNTPIEIRVYN